MSTHCVVTPTGGRGEAFRLLAGYLNAQTFARPLLWIVVDDCDPATTIPPMRAGIEVRHVRPAWRWSPGMNTQAACMVQALAYVPEGAMVAVMEDDDAYLPAHLETVFGALASCDLVGERLARYYNVATRRWRTLPGAWHASLASTAAKGDAVGLLRAICAENSRRIDMDLWRMWGGSRQLLTTGNVVGIKGMPGRGGIGVGHRPEFGEPDPCGDTLRQWLGPELAAEYRWVPRAAA